MVRARQLKHRITIQSATETKDSYGQAIKTWSTYCIRDAEIINEPGSEYFTEQQIYAERPVVFRIRYDLTAKDITPKMRVLYDSNYYDIHSVINNRETNRHINIQCILHNG